MKSLALGLSLLLQPVQTGDRPLTTVEKKIYVRWSECWRDLSVCRQERAGARAELASARHQLRECQERPPEGPPSVWPAAALTFGLLTLVGVSAGFVLLTQ